MNKKVKQMVIDAQNFNSLRQLRKMQNLLNKVKDEFGQIEFNSELESNADFDTFIAKLLYIDNTIENWVKAILESKE